MKIYLAASLFTLADRIFNARLAEFLRARGYAVWLPQENEPRKFSTAAVFTLDKSGIDRSDVVVANMDGSDPDSGTSWECGYGYAKGKMVVTFRTDFRGIGEAEHAGYNIMLWEGADFRADLTCLKFTTIEQVADALDEILKKSHHQSLTPQQRKADAV